MGLEMYLEGKKVFWNHCDEQPQEDGFKVSYHVLQLGYWCKHPNLHGFIVENFAGGKDDCSPVELVEADIEEIIGAVERDALPHTTGFFFGKSDGTEKEEDLKILRAALDWVRRKERCVSKYISYQASW